MHSWCNAFVQLSHWWISKSCLSSICQRYNIYNYLAVWSSFTDPVHEDYGYFPHISLELQLTFPEQDQMWEAPPLIGQNATHQAFLLMVWIWDHSITLQWFPTKWGRDSLIYGSQWQSNQMECHVMTKMAKQSDGMRCHEKNACLTSSLSTGVWIKWRWGYFPH